jgi:hypothetical protein
MGMCNHNTVRKPAILGTLLLAVLVAGIAAGCGSSNAKVAAPTILRFLNVDKSFTPIGFNEQRVSETRTDELRAGSRWGA